MSDTYIDPDTGDLARSGGSFARVTGLDEIGQRVDQALSLVQGEWYFDISLGVPYIIRIFGKTKPTSTEINSIFEVTILSVDGVTRLVGSIGYTLNKNNRVMSIEALVETTEGQLAISFTP